MKRILLVIGGVLNLLLTFFHLFLGYQITLIENIEPGYRELMFMLNAGGTLFILLFTFASLGYQKEMLTTRLGKLLTFFIILLYASRAYEEVVIASGFSLEIFVTCVVIALIYLIVLMLPYSRRVNRLKYAG